mmetsp:Transcript_3053/g.5850  ORF Transcript_3053/g.5850 Transcript_3053/m.5850 type:complete len:267 (-) Transcript_3053:245-1045(-)
MEYKNVRHTRLAGEETILHTCEFQPTQTSKYFTFKYFTVALLLACGIALVCALMAPTQLYRSLPLIGINLILTIPFLFCMNYNRFKQASVALTGHSVLVSQPSLCPKIRELSLNDLSVFATEDWLQTCLGIKEVNFIVLNNHEFSILGIRRPEIFVHQVQRAIEDHLLSGEAKGFGGSISGGRRNDTAAEIELTLQEKADIEEYKTDVQQLTELKNLDHLSLDELNAMEKRINRLDKRLSNISDEINAPTSEKKSQVDPSPLDDYT